MIWQASLKMKQKINSKNKKERKELSKNKSEKQESELEKELEKAGEEPEFNETNLKISQEIVKAPVLERIGDIQEIPIRFDNNLNFSRISEEKENEEGGFKYLKNANREEPKYQDQNYENRIFSDIHKRSEIEEFGKIDLFPRKNVDFTTSNEARPVETNFARYNPVEKIERENLGKNLFERKEIKYKSSR